MLYYCSGLLQVFVYLMAHCRGCLAHQGQHELGSRHVPVNQNIGNEIVQGNAVLKTWPTLVTASEALPAHISHACAMGR